MSCVFCQIVAGTVLSPRVMETDEFIVIRDLHPQAKTHLLVIPKDHLGSLEDAFPFSGVGRPELVGRLFEVGVQAARQEGLLPGGFRSVINTGRDGGQTVFHLHLHILGGGALSGGFGA